MNVLIKFHRPLVIHCQHVWVSFLENGSRIVLAYSYRLISRCARCGGRAAYVPVLYIQPPYTYFLYRPRSTNDDQTSRIYNIMFSILDIIIISRLYTDHSIGSYPRRYSISPLQGKLAYAWLGCLFFAIQY